MFACTLFVRFRTNSQCFRVRYSLGCGRISRVSVYAIRTEANGYLVLACTLFVRMWTDSPCLLDRNICVCGGIDLVCVYAIRAVSDE